MGFYEQQATTEHPELYPGLLLSEVRTLGVLASNLITLDGFVQVSRRNLAKQAGLTPTGAANHLKKLAALGYITKVHSTPDPQRPKLYAPNLYQLHLKAHPDSCTNGRHIDNKAKANAPATATPGNPVANPLATDLATPGNRVTEGEQPSRQLNKEKQTQIKANTNEPQSFCCEGLRLGNHEPSCKSHPVNRNGGTAWNITVEQYQGATPWEYLSHDQQQELHKTRMSERERSAPMSKPQQLEQALQKYKALHLSPGNRAYCITHPEHLFELAIGRAKQFQAAGYEWLEGSLGNAYVEFAAGDLSKFQQLPEVKA